MTTEQLASPYRPNGWTARQVIHHIPDSHLNCYIRFKWALTEERPLIKAYNETAWADLNKHEPIETSFMMLEAVHKKLVQLFHYMDLTQFNRTFIHPELGKELSLAWHLGQYAWHGEHHLGHLQLV